MKKSQRVSKRLIVITAHPILSAFGTQSDHWEYGYGKRFFDEKLNDQITFGYHAVSIDEKRKKFPVSLWDENNISQGQTIKQVWFAGVHSDVGGFYKERGLSDVALIWILENAQAAGMRLHHNWKSKLNPDP